MKTGVRIRVLEGETVDGRTEYEFPAPTDSPDQRIVIGRDPDHCQIVFIDGLRLTGLGNEHVALRRSLGRYQLDLNTHNRVLLDGRMTFEEKELTGTSVLQLGDAVRLEVTVVNDRSATIGNQRVIQSPAVTLGNRRLLAGLAAAVAVVAIGGWWGLRTLSEGTTAARRAAADATRAVEALARFTPVSDEVIARVRDSIYAVVLRNPDGGEDILGTAWVADGGRVVTNAHVVETEGDPQLAAILAAGAELFVRSAVPPHRTHRVTNQAVHPGRRRFRELVEGRFPVQKTLFSLEPLESDSACDVAVLEVEDPGSLARPLSIAPQEVLRGLRSGQAIAMVGYPQEELSPLKIDRPEPVSQQANIVRVTDFFMEYRPDGNNQLVQHSLPVTGGASGSPIVNAAGQVVAVVTAINPVLIPDRQGGGPDGSASSSQSHRIMNPAAVNFGQRADFVRDLLEGRAAEAAREYEADWLASLDHLERLSDQAIPLRRQELSRLLGRDVEPRIIGEVTGRAKPMPADGMIEDAASTWVDVPRGLVGIVAVPRRDVDMDVALLAGTTVLQEASDTRLTFHGDVELANRFGRRLKLATWVGADAATEPVDYRATIVDWGVDPDEYILLRARRLAQREVIRSDEEPTISRELEPVRLDETVSLGEDGKVAAGFLSFSVDEPGTCVVACRPSRPLPCALYAGSDDGPVPVSSPSENPVAVLPVDGAGKPLKLMVVTPPLGPLDKPVEVHVHVDYWRRSP